jgi:vacuolar-type H+-ATPase subunit F/Vma7
VSRIAAIGDHSRLAGYALSGVDVKHATDPDQVREAWLGIGSDVEFVLLTSAARQALPDPLDRRDVLVTVMPA